MNKPIKTKSFMAKSTGIILGLLAVGTVYFMQDITETVHAGEYHIKQEAITGNMSLHNVEGMYAQMFGAIHKYNLIGNYTDKLAVTFRDGSTATVPVSIDYRLPITDEAQLKLHREQISYRNVTRQVVPTIIRDVIQMTANSFGAEEIYSNSRGKFKRLFERQLTEGQLKIRKGANVNAPAELVLDENGQPIVISKSVLTDYGFRIIKVTLGTFDFDDQTDALIKARKEAEQQETLARSEAERAKQDALTAEERGKANVAKAKYEAEVIKIREVIEAQKKTAMSIEATKQANERALQIIAKGKANAESAKLLVEAGLTPLEEANIDKETAIGVAQAMSSVTFPRIMVFGGGAGSDSPLNPFDAVGLKAFQDMARDTQGTSQ